MFNVYGHSPGEDSLEEGILVEPGSDEVEFGPAPEFTLIIARQPEITRGLHDTPQKKVITRGDQYMHQIPQSTVIGMRMYRPRSPISAHFFDVGLGAHEPAPYGHDGHESPDEAGTISYAEWKGRGTGTSPESGSWPLPDPAVSVAGALPANRFLRPRSPKDPPAAANLVVQGPDRRQPAREAALRTASGVLSHETAEHVVASDDSQDDADFKPILAGHDDADDMDEDQDSIDEPQVSLPPSRPNPKLTATQRNASTGPSTSGGGRPTAEVNQEIERVGHRIQRKLVDLASKAGLTYETLIRKIGLSH